MKQLLIIALLLAAISCQRKKETKQPPTIQFARILPPEHGNGIVYYGFDSSLSIGKIDSVVNTGDHCIIYLHEDPTGGIVITDAKCCMTEQELKEYNFKQFHHDSTMQEVLKNRK